MAITKTVFDVVKDSIKPYIDLNAGNIAAVEKTSTAAAAHLAGTQIVFKGKLYDVIQDIAQNGTIIVGTNIVAADSLSSDIATLSNREQERWGTVNLFDKDIMADVQIIELSYKTLIMKPNTTYTVSTDLPQNLENFANIFVYNSSGVPDTDANGVWNGQTRTFTTNSDGIINVAYRTKEFTNTSTKWFLNHNFQIEEGNIATAFQPYAAPNVTLTQDTKGLPQDMNGLTANAFANGAVNELLCDATSNVQTGLTYIVEDDGTIKVSGTNTSNETAQIAVTISYVDWDSTKRYKISGCPSNGSSSSYRLGLTINKSDGWSRTLTELGDGLEFQLASNETKIKVSINISAGYAISGTLTFKPMITVADMPNSDYAHYVPYCKSNKELTELWNANKYVEQAINWESNVDTYYDRTNTVAHFRVNEFTRHCILDVTDLVTKFAMNAGGVSVLFNIGGSFKPFVNERKDVPIITKDSAYYDGFVTKASSHNGISFTAKESIPSGVSITFTLDWFY